YGPAFELCENLAVKPESEEYVDSEKYQVRVWPIDDPKSLRDWIGRINRIRRENSALQSDGSLRFHPIDNEQLIAYSKANEDLSSIILVIVNLDSRFKQSGWTQVPLEDFRFDAH